MSFPPYERYEDSGQAWLGELPSHWSLGKFSREISIAEGQVDPEVEPFSSMPLIAPNHVESGTGKLLSLETAHEQGASSGKYLCRSGDVIYSKIRPALAKAVIAPQDCLCSADMYPMSGRGRIANDFMLWLLLSPEFTGWSVLEADRVAMPKINRETLNDLRLPIPPTGDQAAIVAFLDRETAKIDALVAEQRRLIELLKEKRQAVISHAVAKGLDPNAPMKDSGVEWLGQVPEHWEVVRVKWVAKTESGHTPDKKIAAYWENCTIPWVSLHDTKYLKDHDYISETARYVNEKGIANSSARILPEGAVVFSRDATIGRCGITTRPMAVSQHFIAWLCGDEIVPEFLLRCLRAMGGELERLTFGATVKTIGMEDVSRLTIALPPVPEQAAIVEHIRQNSMKLDALIGAAERAVALLKERRTALISAAVTGKIDVRGAAPAAAEAA